MAKKEKKCKVVINNEFCKGCALCIEFCKTGILKVSEKLNQMGYNYAEPESSGNCNGCMLCVLVCPDLVIEVYDE